MLIGRGSYLQGDAPQSSRAFPPEVGRRVFEDHPHANASEQQAQDTELSLQGQLVGDGGSYQGSRDLQPGSRPEPEIIDFGYLNGPDRLPNLFKKVGGEAPQYFQ